ncbi:molybdate ABC transporter substrate-binding protein [Psychromonas algarum]|uniref:molybdate ABC transporter substrate-binding protein n=1 Tax=Psychromonas algarum TaxID=2555643 RepID=UPI0014197011|nr:molybdate ABC transporter substrate-binding protein [Psychromonas sp. RZ22]
MNRIRLIISFILISLWSAHSFALASTVKNKPLNIAVASNFKLSAQHIAHEFTEISGIKVNISSASTATLYQQILRGAPFDVFLSADQKHIDLLIDANKVNQEHEFIYAQGRLVFWKPDITRVPTLQDFLLYDGRLAIANPKFAPYGIAAEETLKSIKKWQVQQYIKGNNINQAYQFVESKNVRAGLVAYASVIQKQQKNYVIIPQEWHHPIKQAGIVLNNDETKHAQLFRQFLLSENMQKYIKSQGYN